MVVCECVCVWWAVRVRSEGRGEDGSSEGEVGVEGGESLKEGGAGTRKVEPRTASEAEEVSSTRRMGFRRPVGRCRSEPTEEDRTLRFGQGLLALLDDGYRQQMIHSAAISEL